MLQEGRTDVVNYQPRDVALQKALEIARTELARRRRGLGNLTHEQETVIEDLLFQTVNKVWNWQEEFWNGRSPLRARGSSGHSCSVARIGRRHRGNH